MALGSVGLPATQLPTCGSVHGPESPLGLGASKLPLCPARIALELSSPPKYKGIPPAPEYGFGNCLGFWGSAPNCSCHGGGLESRPDPSLKPYLLVFSRQARPSARRPALPARLCWLTAPIWKSRASCSDPLRPHSPHPAFMDNPSAATALPVCLENLWFVGDPQPGERSCYLCLPRPLDAGTT